MITRDLLDGLLQNLARTFPVADGELWISAGGYAAMMLPDKDLYVVRFVDRGKRVLRWEVEPTSDFQSVIRAWDRAVQRWTAGEGEPWP